MRTQDSEAKKNICSSSNKTSNEMLTTVSPPCISVKQSCVHTPTFRCLCCLVTWLGTVTSWGTRVWTFSATLGKSLSFRTSCRESPVVLAWPLHFRAVCTAALLVYCSAVHGQVKSVKGIAGFLW